MARKPNHRFEKRKRELAREARAAARRARKLERGQTSTTQRHDGEDPDLAGIVVGPQPRDEITPEEAERAVQRAMNPAKLMPGDEPAPVRGSRLFVGNLDFGVEEADLRDFFTEAGFTVSEATLVKDRHTGEPRGFAFVEVAGMKEASRAVAQLNGATFAGRSLRLDVADRRR